MWLYPECSHKIMIMIMIMADVKCRKVDKEYQSN